MSFLCAIVWQWKSGQFSLHIDCDFVQFTYKIYEFFYFISGHTITFCANVSMCHKQSGVSEIRNEAGEEGMSRDVFFPPYYYLSLRRSKKDGMKIWRMRKRDSIWVGFISCLFICLGVSSTSLCRFLCTLGLCVAFKIAKCLLYLNSSCDWKMLLYVTSHLSHQRKHIFPFSHDNIF